MSQSIATIALVVADYDDAISFYVDKLGFALLSDLDMGGGKRWVTVAPAGGGARLLLAKADGAEQSAHIGNQLFSRNRRLRAGPCQLPAARGEVPRAAAARGLWFGGGVRGPLRQ